MALALKTSVGVPLPTREDPAPGVVPDSPAALFGAFSRVDPSGAILDPRALVGQAAASLDVLGRHGSAEDWLHWNGLAASDPGFGQREGVVFRLEVSPGTLAIRRRDYVRAEATAERARPDTEEALQRADHFARLAAEVDESGVPARRGRVTSWSGKSRAKMVERLQTLDYSPMVSKGAPAMITLTYPGDWLPVAPDAATCADHITKFRKRYFRRWGHTLIGTWKREFQKRGAPHYHILAVPPAGRDFDLWVSATWAAIVAHPDPEERRRHELAGTNVDRREGARYSDPRRVGVYFSKHGSFSAKDYQNEAPAEWLADPEAGVGRFWGVWGLKPVVAAVHVDPEVADAVRRTARRWQAATLLRERPSTFVGLDGQTYRRPSARSTVTVTVWRKRTTVDRETGEIAFRWVKRRTKKKIPARLAGRAGFLAVNDGPALAMDLGRVAARAAGVPEVGGAVAGRRVLP